MFDFQEDENDEDGAPNFGDDLTPPELVTASKEYAEWAIEEYDTFDGLEISSVDFEVSQDLKRTAGKAVKKTREWGDELTIRLAWGAYEKWGWNDDIREVIRHELIHIKQYKEQGTGDHGLRFKIMADKVGVPVHCKKFTEYNYEVRCTNCDELVAGRYRNSKLVKNADDYNSKCCGASCYSENVQ